jgi:hypothetical protein
MTSGAIKRKIIGAASQRTTTMGVIANITIITIKGKPSCLLFLWDQEPCGSQVPQKEESNTRRQGKDKEAQSRQDQLDTQGQSNMYAAEVYVRAICRILEFVEGGG